MRQVKKINKKFICNMVDEIKHIYPNSNSIDCKLLIFDLLDEIKLAASRMEYGLIKKDLILLEEGYKSCPYCNKLGKISKTPQYNYWKCCGSMIP